MVWTILKVLLAVAAALALYLFLAGVIRQFGKTPPPAEPDPANLRKVNYRYRCAVCGTEVTMTSAPNGDVPDSPRHCREDMHLVVEGGQW